MGSDSDLDLVRKTVEALKSFGIETTVRVMSAHRSPAEVAAFSTCAYENGYGVIVAAAGMAAHLAGAVAANTALPVVALPLKSKSLEGIDALLASVMMPPGVPVATVGVDCAANAGYLAAEILAASDDELYKKLLTFKEEQRQKNINADRKVSAEFGGN
jgi:5-(carboxyamino)imidazole ribonucleotide mutase